MSDKHKKSAVNMAGSSEIARIQSPGNLKSEMYQAYQSQSGVKAEKSLDMEAREAFETAVKNVTERNEAIAKSKAEKVHDFQDEMNRKHPMLLDGFDKMCIKTDKHSPDQTADSCAPWYRPIDKLVRYGVINLDKPPKPSSHEVVAFVKRILSKAFNVAKTGHSGTLDPMVTGCLITCLGDATRLVKSQQTAGKEYVAVIRFHGLVQGGEAKLAKALERVRGAVFQRPPLISAVKRQLRVRRIQDIILEEFDVKRKLAVFRVSCEAGTYIRTLCQHIGYLVGVGAHMQELRRVRSGHLTEAGHNMVSMHDLLDAVKLFVATRDELPLRNIIMPMEILLTNFPRIIIKDSAVAAICHGGELQAVGVLRFSHAIQKGMKVVISSVKGEAVALATATVDGTEIEFQRHDTVAKSYRVLMDRETYPKSWGKGEYTTEKKRMIQEGTLDRHGRPNERTPSTWRSFGSSHQPRSGPMHPLPPQPIAPGVPSFFPPDQVAFGHAPSYAFPYPTLPDPNHSRREWPQPPARPVGPPGTEPSMLLSAQWIPGQPAPAQSVTPTRGGNSGYHGRGGAQRGGRGGYPSTSPSTSGDQLPPWRANKRRGEHDQPGEDQKRQQRGTWDRH